MDGLIGELVLCPAVIRREVSQQEYKTRIRFLIQHGLIHIMGLDHQTAADQLRWKRYEKRLQS